MILVIAEQRQGRLHRASWEALAAAQELAGEQSPGGEQLIDALVVGGNVSAAAAELSEAAVGAVHAIGVPALEPYTPDGFVEALVQAIGVLAPKYSIRQPLRLSTMPKASSARSWSSPGTQARTARGP